MLFSKLNKIPNTRLIWVFIILLSISFSCKEDSKKIEKIDEIRLNKKFKYADIIRNPISAQKPLDTNKVAKMYFKKATYDFGKIREGQIITHNYEFINNGTVPLIISDARSTCGCTVPKYPNRPIMPNKKGHISVKFDTNDKFGKQLKPITLISNTYPSETNIYMSGEIFSK